MNLLMFFVFSILCALSVLSAILNGGWLSIASILLALIMGILALIFGIAFIMRWEDINLPW